LGEVASDDAVDRLTELAVPPLERDGVRVAALAALGDRRPEGLLDELMDNPSGTVAWQLAGSAPAARPVAPGPVARDLEVGVGERCGAADCSCRGR
jgi:hypothetical protein